jgi:SAM-dependent methyltransferase
MAKDLKNLLIYYIHDRELARCGGQYLSGRMVDIGCGTKPYQKLLAPFVTEHVGVDREQPFNAAARVDMVGSAYAIPAGDASFDCAISTAALEHLAEPEQALRECRRILKPNGIAVYTVPFFWHVHAAPWDFYRFTHFGLRHLFEKAGFEIIELKALSGFWVTFGQLFVYYIYRFHRGPLRYVPIIPVAGLVVQLIAYVLEKLDKAEDWTWMYLVVARNCANASPSQSGCTSHAQLGDKPR